MNGDTEAADADSNVVRRSLRAALTAALADAEAFGTTGFGGGTAPEFPASLRGFGPAAQQQSAAGTATELERVAAEACECRLCPLGALRTNAVPGQGNPNAELMFVGEAPGADEDRAGLAFVGAAGELLTKMIGAMGLSRDEVFIANVLKCRPPGNRDPAAEEVARCLPFLRRQIEAVRPRVVCALGSHAAHALLGSDLSVARLRGAEHEMPGVAGVRVVVTYHPAYLLRTPSEKAKTWADLQYVLRLLGREIPPRRGSES